MNRLSDVIGFLLLISFLVLCTGTERGMSIFVAYLLHFIIIQLGTVEGVGELCFIAQIHVYNNIAIIVYIRRLYYFTNNTR